MGGMSIVEVEQYAATDEGEYVTLSGTIGQISYEITIDDGPRGLRIDVLANGERHALVL